MKQKKNTKKRFWLAVLLCSSFFCLSACGGKSYFQTKEEAGLSEESGGESDSAEENERSGAKESETDIKDGTKEEASGNDKSGTACYVDVSGAVNCPGVYLLKAGSRVFEAIQMAGGLRADADTRDLNQAAVITDGQKLYIYTVGEMASKTAPGSEAGAVETDGKVNINTASKEELMTLPGIGESKADAIIAYRQEKGPFSSAEEIKNISGIKEGVYSKIADFIKVS